MTEWFELGEVGVQRGHGGFLRYLHPSASARDNERPCETHAGGVAQASHGSAMHAETRTEGCSGAVGDAGLEEASSSDGDFGTVVVSIVSQMSN